MDRRDFLLRVAGGALVAGSGAAAWSALAGAGREASFAAAGGPLRIPRVLGMDGLTLTARRGTAPVAPGVSSPVWTLGESAATGATLQARRGERVRVELRNELDEPTIVHWHGLRPPQEADGHPRLAIGPGGRYAYDFVVDDPAGTYWYHPHPHMRTAEQTYMGMAGLILVRDAAEEALGLPSGAREIPLVLQDKRLDEGGALVYRPFGPDMMEGYLGDVPFVNGTRSPWLEVDAALYRLRVLNASSARIFRVARSDGRPLVLIGGDGGFLPAPATVPYVDLGTGERADLLADFGDLAPGTAVRLVSLAFPSPSAMPMGRGMGPMRGRGMMGGMGRGAAQGTAMDLLELRVARGVRDSARVPAALPAPPAVDGAAAARRRVFRFDSMMMSHTINGRAFQLDRIDERVPFGATEAWSFVNDGPFPHPVHMHAAHFSVLSRTGGRGRVLPWETGPKDTVLVLPGERVEVAVRFDRHRGLFLMHCHNLEHEDMGMMLNFLIE
ncbi:MAG TPA: multicopper oxidase domain-containing protein [Longimicrobium sp.]